MAAGQLFTDWQTGDVITATKLNQMKNELARLSGGNTFADAQTFSADVTVGGALAVSGPATLLDSISVASAATFSGTTEVSGRFSPRVSRPADMNAVWGTGTEHLTGLAVFDFTSSIGSGPGFFGAGLHIAGASNRAFQVAADTGSSQAFKIRAKSDQPNTWKDWQTILVRDDSSYAVTGNAVFTGYIGSSDGATGTGNVDFPHGYDIYVEDTGAGSNNTRMWWSAPNGGEMVFGPRGGASTLDQIRLRGLTKAEEGLSVSKLLVVPIK